MAINSTFYDGTVDEIAFSTGISRVGSSEYGVAGIGDYKVTAVSGVDRTVSVAAGAAWGKGIHDVLTAAQTIAIPSVASGNRWDLIAVHRVWGTNTTTIIRIAGNSTKAIPSRAIGYGTTDDQPIALVRVTAGATTIQEIVDLRCWSGFGGVHAKDQLVLSYLNKPGSSVMIDRTIWQCVIGTADAPEWVATGGETRWAIVNTSPGWVCTGDVLVSHSGLGYRMDVCLKVTRGGSPWQAATAYHSPIGPVIHPSIRGGAGGYFYYPVSAVGAGQPAHTLSLGFDSRTGVIALKASTSLTVSAGSSFAFNTTYYVPYT